jgi:hypothetical protein
MKFKRVEQLIVMEEVVAKLAELLVINYYWVNKKNHQGLTLKGFVMARKKDDALEDNSINTKKDDAWKEYFAGYKHQARWAFV